MFIGCVQPPEEPAEVVATFAAFPTEPITEAKPLRPEPDPFFTAGESDTLPEPAEPQPLKPVGFTGCRVYGDPETCNPCRFLHDDLRFLRECHGWTVSDSEAIAADWQFLPPRPTDSQIPLVETWIDGQLTDSQTGYTDDPEPAARRHVLLELVARHPIRTRGR